MKKTAPLGSQSGKDREDENKDKQPHPSKGSMGRNPLSIALLLGGGSPCDGTLEDISDARVKGAFEVAREIVHG